MTSVFFFLLVGDKKGPIHFDLLLVGFFAAFAQKTLKVLGEFFEIPYTRLKCDEEPEAIDNYYLHCLSLGIHLYLTHVCIHNL